MVDFVDLHCHLLFRVDDGAQDEDAMKKMIDIAYFDGIRHICFTPHFKIFEFEDEEQMHFHMGRLDRRFKVACDYVNEKYPDLKLYLGNEIMYHADISDSLFNNRCHFLGNSSYALIEFPPDCTGFEIENTIIKLLRKGIRPVIAHIERYSAFIKDPSLAKSLRESGAVLQVNARSVTRFKLGRIASFLKSCFKKKLVDIVATDAHNDSSLPPQLSNAYEVISKKYGQEYANDVFCRKPLSILLNEKKF